MKQFWSIKDVAKYLEVDYKTIYRLVRQGELPAGKVGGVYRIRKEDVDAYFEQQKAARLSEALGAQESGQGRALKCSVCLRLLDGKDQIGGRCAYEGCDAPICRTCWADGGVRYCAAHRPSRTVQLDEARERLAAGEIPLLVTALEAKQRELGFVSRFDRKMHKITTLRYPLDGRVMRVTFSWPEIHTEMDESARLMELLRTGYLDREIEQEMPLNVVSCYTIPASGPGTPGLVLETRVLSHLPTLVRQGFDTRSASLADLLRVLEQCIEVAEAQDVAYLVGVAATTGWAPEARAYVEASGTGRSFSHRLVLPCLVDLHEMTLVYNESDSRLAPMVSLFAPRLPEEEISQATEYIAQALLASHGVTVEEVCEEANMDEQYVRIAFERLVEQGTHRWDQVPSIGQVLSKFGREESSHRRDYM